MLEAGKDWGPAVGSNRSPIGNLQQVKPTNELFLTCHDFAPMSSPVEGRWFIMARRFSVSGFARTKDAGRFSGFVSTAIGDNGTAVPLVALRHGSNSGAAPTAATNKARKDGSIIATGNGSTGGGGPA